MKKRILFYSLLPFLILTGALQIADKKLKEISGLVVSSENKDIIWVHNDSGDDAVVYAIQKDGKVKHTVNYAKEVLDCEDMALNIDAKGISYLYIGDIGDNDAKRPFISIYKFKEPSIGKEETSIVENVEVLNLKFPDGSRDAECLMVDLIDQKIYILSKKEDSVGVYSTPLKFITNETVILKKEGVLFFPGFKKFKYITAGDISQDGKHILVKSYLNIFYWSRNSKQSLFDCLKHAPKILPYKPEKQGEAIGFTPDAKAYYTISEGQTPEIIYSLIK